MKTDGCVWHSKLLLVFMLANFIALCVTNTVSTRVERKVTAMGLEEFILEENADVTVLDFPDEKTATQKSE
uniref:hypothetical protein n=1 Tax=Thaumasiovibrio occultus TaxID=1891184 RepID=UPI000B363AF0|nr:hypothetical protein [Thaumasiovibrio occultus]